MTYQKLHKQTNKILPFHKKLLQSILFTCSFMLLTAFTGTTTLDYTRTVETPPNMPKGNPDLTVGIVVHPNSTGMEMLADSSQNIRFTVFMNAVKTEVAVLRSSSRFDYTPKKITFIDEKQGFSYDNIYEFSALFDWKNYQWDYIRFMPFASVVEWVTKEKLIEYLTTWAHIFEKAGWQRKDRKIEDVTNPQNFIFPTPEHDTLRYCCSWTTNEYEAVVAVSLRNKEQYKRSYVPKKERKKITFTPDGYIAFITITKKSQYPGFYDTKQKEVKK